MTKIILLFNTVKYLKYQQLYFRLYYLLRTKMRKIMGFKYKLHKDSKAKNISFYNSIPNKYSTVDNGKFQFLNLSKKFDNYIDWNYDEHGKLWTYNLNYFEYLKKEEDLVLIHDFIENIQNIKDGLESYPISLRGINWIKFLLEFDIKEKKVDDSLYAQYYILMDNLEYHLLGNHLLENGFSLLFGAYYFNDKTLHVKAKEILLTELDEQILADGAHFELSPMYHQIILFRLLDCINLLQNNLYIKDKEFLYFLEKKASLMLGWLQKITFDDGSIPLFNDSANKIAPTSFELFDYAKNLKLDVLECKLNSSGYRKYKNINYECILDVGHIGASYIPGHAHADTFNFELSLKGKPFIVDTGTSTYEVNERRMVERSTSAHNTVEVEALNQSEVWSGFRVANRANITQMKETRYSIEAVHDGYKKKLDALHVRKFSFQKESISILDRIIAPNEFISIARLHFHPNIDEDIIKSHLVLDNIKYKICNYQYAKEFNHLETAKSIEIYFTDNSSLEIKI